MVCSRRHTSSPCFAMLRLVSSSSLAPASFASTPPSPSGSFQYSSLISFFHFFVSLFVCVIPFCKCETWVLFLITKVHSFLANG
ncbi:hypothetical protein LINPERPRIM_LOCUS8851 [Linum perenne]